MKIFRCSLTFPSPRTLRKGRDVLGSARTGSGKTLSFLVPVLELLYRKKWGAQDGLGALIISPTRELAVQIFEVLRAIGGYHSFSAGLIIGGKNLKDESERLSRMNILVATPGRLLQHMDQTFGFECDNLQLLVLDEADRILDMGFSRTLNALLSHIPRKRQTLLFSATQTDSVKDLARLSLAEPVYVGVKEEGSETATPKQLDQHYVVCDLDKKLDILWSFVKSHAQSKILAFLSSGKQVRFVFETFRRMHPGMMLLHLHGKQKQTTRLQTVSKFTTSKHAVLFATDLAARGLDFPAVDWVLQVDAPEDADTYIHRVGRTARYESKGHALILLCPSEEAGMLDALKKKEIKAEKIKIKESKTESIEKKLQNFAFQEPEVKYLAQRAFVSYMRSVYLHKDKAIFQLDKLPADRFAAALGLPGTPKIKFLAREKAKQKKNASRDVDGADGKEDSGSECESEGGPSDKEEKDMDETANVKKSGMRTKYDRMFERKNQNILSEHYSKLIDHEANGDLFGSDDDNGSDSEFMTLKRADHELPIDLPESAELSKRKLKMGTSKKALIKFRGLGQRLLFDDDGRAHDVYDVKDAEKELAGKDVLGEGQVFAEGERTKLKAADVMDKMVAKEKKKEKKRKRKERERGDEEDKSLPGVELAGGEDFSDDVYTTIPLGDVEDIEPPQKKCKRSSSRVDDRSNANRGSLENDEELALALLNG